MKKNFLLSYLIGFSCFSNLLASNNNLVSFGNYNNQNYVSNKQNFLSVSNYKNQNYIRKFVSRDELNSNSNPVNLKIYKRKYQYSKPFDTKVTRRSDSNNSYIKIKNQKSKPMILEPKLPDYIIEGRKQSKEFIQLMSEIESFNIFENNFNDFK